MTGQYPHRIGLGHMVKDLEQPGYRGRLSDEAVTIAQVLNSGGYRSFISGKWHLGTPDPTQHGFEEFYGTIVSASSFWNPNRYLRLPKDRQPRQYEEGKFYGTDALTDHAIDFLTLARKTPEKPWFLYLAYNAPHFPIQAPKETIAKYADRYTRGWDKVRAERLKKLKQLGLVGEGTPLTPRSPFFDWGEEKAQPNPAWDSLPANRRADLARRMAIFAAMVDRMDENIGRVLADLRKNGEWDNTLIVFLSDNGACAEWDPFGFDIKSGPRNILHTGDQLDKMGSADSYHSVGSGWANASNTPWRLYKHYNHEGGIATPCIIHWPNAKYRRESINTDPAHLIDLLPTFLAASGVKYPDRLQDRDTLPLPGRSLLPSLKGEKVEPRQLFFEHEGHRGVRDGRWKLVALRGRPWELYDMATDRIEMKNLAATHPDLVHRLSTAWDQWAKANHVTPLPVDYGVEYVKPLKE